MPHLKTYIGNEGEHLHPYWQMSSQTEKIKNVIVKLEPGFIF